ncbi:MAG: hypothetical protein ACR2FY_07650 [Pirellulaceae bacterium]
MPSQTSAGKPDPKLSVRPDSTGHLPPDRDDPYPDIPRDDAPGLVGGPTTESIPGTAHDDPLDPLARREKKVVVSLPKENDGGEAALSGRPRETGGERPSNH